MQSTTLPTEPNHQQLRVEDTTFYKSERIEARTVTVTYSATWQRLKRKI